MVTGAAVEALFDFGHQLGGCSLGDALGAADVSVGVAVLAGLPVTTERNAYLQRPGALSRMLPLMPRGYSRPVT